MVMRMHLKVTFIRTLTAKFKDAVNLNYCDCVRAHLHKYMLANLLVYSYAYSVYTQL